MSGTTCTAGSASLPWKQARQFAGLQCCCLLTSWGVAQLPRWKRILSRKQACFSSEMGRMLGLGRPCLARAAVIVMPRAAGPGGSSRASCPPQMTAPLHPAVASPTPTCPLCSDARAAQGRCVSLLSHFTLYSYCCAVTHELHKAGMLPAIWFIFSRRECDLAARQLALHGVQLTSNEGKLTCTERTAVV